jgi:hypothetical protein
MKVALFFLPRLDSSLGLMSSLYGRFNLGGFLFIHDTMLESFWTISGSVFSRFICKTSPIWREKYEFLLLSVDEDEQQRLLATCLACAQVRKPFNLQDILLLHAPFREVVDLPIDQAPTLNNAQAMVLILRECLRTDNRLRECVDGLHSRQVVLEDLFKGLHPLSVPVCWANLSSLVRWDGERNSIKAGDLTP